MPKYIVTLLISLLLLGACHNSQYRGSSRQYKKSHRHATSGKGSDFGRGIFVNPFQGRAKAKMNAIKKKKRRRSNSNMFNRKSFAKKKLSRKRLRSSGSRKKGSIINKKKNKNLFKNRKE